MASKRVYITTRFSRASSFVDHQTIHHPSNKSRKPPTHPSLTHIMLLKPSTTTTAYFTRP
ncbi:hypothetical protein L209DRAFT_758973 [Thermothelomyces heterothallicus CBS 203.75]